MIIRLLLLLFVLTNICMAQVKYDEMGVEFSDSTGSSGRVDSIQSKNWQKYVLTPSEKQVYFKKVVSIIGNVSHADRILHNDSVPARMSYPVNGERPVIILDAGRLIGGYTTLKVIHKTGTPVLRIAYSDRREWLYPAGDFGEYVGYLSKILFPTPPLNSERYETYTISDSGIYTFPMMEGGQCFAGIYLESPGTSVDIDFIRNDMTTDLSPYQGHFICSDELLTRLWYASAYAVQMESCEPTANMITRFGQAAVVKLRGMSEIVLARPKIEFKSYQLEFDFKVLRSADRPSGAGWVFSAQDENNAFVWKIDLEDRLHCMKKVDGDYQYIKNPVLLPMDIIDNRSYHLKMSIDHGTITTFINDQNIDQTTAKNLIKGRFGFCQNKYELAFVDNISVRDDFGSVLFSDDFETSLSQWTFGQTPPYMGHGPKREKLIWNGDLYFGNRNIYYSTWARKHIKESLKLFAKHQKNDGYIHGVLDPSSQITPEGFGHYQSDQYSAWYIPAVWDYFLFTGDTFTTKFVYPAVLKDLEYLDRYIDPEKGLFFQRDETKKGPGSLGEGYTLISNLAVHTAFETGSWIADKLGDRNMGKLYQSKADKLKAAINSYFWNENGFYNGLLKNELKHPNANALSLGLKFPTKAQSLRIIENHENNATGKFELAAIRGKFFNNRDIDALKRIRMQEGEGPGPSFWPKTVTDPQGPRSTTWESMKNTGAPYRSMTHGDTGLAYVLSESVLGVYPTDIGYVRYHAIPHPGDIRWAQGRIPTAYGPIDFSWEFDRNLSFKALLVSPQGTIANVGIPKVLDAFTLYLNDKIIYRSDQKSKSDTIKEDDNYIFLNDLTPGKYEMIMK